MQLVEVNKAEDAELHHKVSPDFCNVSIFPIAFVVRVVFSVSAASHTTYVLMVHTIVILLAVYNMFNARQ